MGGPLFIQISSPRAAHRVGFTVAALCIIRLVQALRWSFADQLRSRFMKLSLHEPGPKSRETDIILRSAVPAFYRIGLLLQTDAG